MVSIPDWVVLRTGRKVISPSHNSVEVFDQCRVSGMGHNKGGHCTFGRGINGLLDKKDQPPASAYETSAPGPGGWSWPLAGPGLEAAEPCSEVGALPVDRLQTDFQGGQGAQTVAFRTLEPATPHCTPGPDPATPGPQPGIADDARTDHLVPAPIEVGGQDLVDEVSSVSPST